MEEEEDGEMGTPFWVQNTTKLRRVDRFRRGVSSAVFSSGVLLFILLVTAVLFMVIVIPTTLTSAHNHIFKRSNSAMKNWDFVNLVLVLIALFFGFISKNNKNNSSDDSQQYYDNYRSQISTSNNVAAEKSNTNDKWYGDYSDRRDLSSSYYYQAHNTTSGLRRNSTSYPDLHLRHQTLSLPNLDYYNNNDHRRFYDDSNIDSDHIVELYAPVYNSRQSWKQSDTTSDYSNIQEVETSNIRSWKQADTMLDGDVQVKDIYVANDDDAVTSKLKDDEKVEEFPYAPPPLYHPPPPSPPPPPPPPQRRPIEQKAERIYQSLPKHQTTKDVRVVDSRVTQEPSLPQPPPMQQVKSGGGEYKKRRGGNASKDQNFITSYYQKKKKKRQRQRSVDNLDVLFHQSQPLKTHTPPPPPPPPPPPSSSVFHNLFSTKKGKRRRIPSYPHPTSPPPPPPPPPPQFKVTSVSKPKTSVQTPTTNKPPIHVQVKSFSSLDDNLSSGGSSPLYSIPPPPPLPPFKMREWKHIVEGDYVRIQSNPSSRSGSPDTDDAENCSPKAETTPVPLFCPSPDVDTKADNFIARFRAGLKLEKIDSFNKKQVSRMSPLGPSQN